MDTSYKEPTASFSDTISGLLGTLALDLSPNQRQPHSSQVSLCRFARPSLDQILIISPSRCSHLLLYKHLDARQALPSWTWALGEVLPLMQQYPGGVSEAILLTSLNEQWSTQVGWHWLHS